jgi:hypothetical protein
MDKCYSASSPIKISFQHADIDGSLEIWPRIYRPIYIKQRGIIALSHERLNAVGGRAELVVFPT